MDSGMNNVNNVNNMNNVNNINNMNNVNNMNNMNNVNNMNSNPFSQGYAQGYTGMAPVQRTRLPSIQYLINDIKEHELMRSNESITPVHSQVHMPLNITPTATPATSFSKNYTHSLPMRANSMSSVSSIPSVSSVSSVSIVPNLSSVTLETPPGKSTDSAARNRKRRSNLPKPVVSRLNHWLSMHLDNPYPTAQEKIKLMEETGLNSVQLSNWFINVRRRKVFNEYYELANLKKQASPAASATTTNATNTTETTALSQVQIEEAQCEKMKLAKKQSQALQQLHKETILQTPVVSKQYSSSSSAHGLAAGAALPSLMSPSPLEMLSSRMPGPDKRGSISQATIADENDLETRFSTLPLTRRKKLIDRLQELKNLTGSN